VADLDERVSANALALGLPKRAWRTIRWRDGRADPLRSRFARVRVRTAPIKHTTGVSRWTIMRASSTRNGSVPRIVHSQVWQELIAEAAASIDQREFYLNTVCKQALA